MNALNWFSSPLQRTLFIGSFYGWAIVELVNTLILGRRFQGERRQDRGSYWGVLIAIYSAITLIFVIRGLRLGLLPTLFQWIGLALVWIGILVREWAILSLGRAFSVIVRVDTDQSLIMSGPYRWIRHPSYTGSLITIGGLGLAAGSWLGAILAIAIVLIGYSYRAYVEERVLLEAFGDQYHAYMRQTGRFLPRVR